MNMSHDISTAGTRVPSGFRVKWYQRSWELHIDVEGPELENTIVSVTDDGQIVMQALSEGVQQTLSLQLLHGVTTSKSRHGCVQWLPIRSSC